MESWVSGSQDFRFLTVVVSFQSAGKGPLISLRLVREIRGWEDVSFDISFRLEGRGSGSFSVDRCEKEKANKEFFY